MQLIWHFGPGQGNRNGKCFSTSHVGAGCWTSPFLVSFTFKTLFSIVCFWKLSKGCDHADSKLLHMMLLRSPRSDLTFQQCESFTWWDLMKAELLSAISQEVLTLLAAVVPFGWYITPKFAGLVQVHQNHIALSCSCTFFCVFLVKFGSSTKWFSWIESCEVPTTQNLLWEGVFWAWKPS